MTTSHETAADASAVPVGAALWRPSPDGPEANLTRFMRFLGERRSADVSDYAALYDWSVAEPEAFWSAVWDF